ncbi:MAG: hypothetical protein P4L40_03140 [Terracidiphilus sp.]|nr:hypothetical protein [Terracidiphilus sp.]
MPSSAGRATGTRPEHEQPPQPSPTALFVSTTLNHWHTERPDAFNRDFQINDTAYRRLDPEYYAWLRSRMNMAKLSVLAGQLSQESFDATRDCFNRIHEWAIGYFGEAVLHEAVRALHTRDYQPPVVEPWDSREAPPAAGKVAAVAEALAMVDAIRERAIGLGWKHERLYAAGKPSSQNRGLVSYLNPGDRIGEVTLESIEIILPNDVRQRFYNPDTDQPWVIRLGHK